MPQEYRHNMPQGLNNFSAKGLMLYILPSPLILKFIFCLLTTNFLKLALTATALFFFYSGAHMTRTTLLRLHKQPSSRKHTEKDNRTWGAIYITVGVIVLMFLIRRPLAITFVMATSAFIGYALCYGLTAKKSKPAVNYDNMPSPTQKAIKGAYDDLTTIESLCGKLEKEIDKPLVNSIEKVLDQSYVIMDLLVQSPEDATRARRFLNVYINRIKEILQQYIKLSQHDKADNVRERLITTLDEVETALREKKSQLLDDDLFKLDIQLEVLDEQIKHEE
ncbi:MAG: 5-bromo-4-chloroindolyl phosphate hydrolysis family protein [Gammaproteobacteria bacterium]|nr:5-bromo-4-chloroindolyl phosphate hydrolysis family protein [Gammaproteobacteria bacterium]